MQLRKKKEIVEPTLLTQPAPTALPGQQLGRLRFYEHWQTAGHMFKNYPGVDSYFEEAIDGKLRRPFMRWVWLPLSFGLGNQGWGLWLRDEDGQEELAGQIYLQHRRMITHVNDIEVNRSFQGRGLSHALLGLAEQQARLRHKRFLTLAVTLTNSRAVNLYRTSGFLDQHHRYFYLARPWWSEPSNAYLPQKSPVRLVPLGRARARRNLQRFFTQEIRAAEPLVAPVWESLYRPTLPSPGQGFSFALYQGDRPLPQGHADFFDWSGRGRWRIYLDPTLWGSPIERAFLEAFLYQSRGYNQLGMMVGTRSHHDSMLSFTRELGLVERDTERMLMIRPLED